MELLDLAARAVLFPLLAGLALASIAGSIVGAARFLRGTW
jgi:hypothetical protein